MSTDIRRFAEQVERTSALDVLDKPLANVASRLFASRRLKDALHGAPLGHPLHPVLTDLPIGFWTTAWVLDVFGGKRSRRTADLMVAAGVLAALPTVASGLADWSELDGPVRRTGVAHAIAMDSATVLYAWSLLARLRGRRGKAILLSQLAAAVATAGAYLGGHLTFRNGAGVNRNAFEEPALREWTPVLEEAALREGEPVVVHAGGVAVMVVRRLGQTFAIADRCSHLGGPLHEGTIDDQACAVCPWHGSAFRLRDGSVVHGPATSPQAAFEVRVRGGKIELRRV